MVSRKGFHVDSTRDLAVASLISGMMAGTVTRRSAFAKSEDIDGSFFSIGPASKTMVWIGLGEAMVMNKVAGFYSVLYNVFLSKSIISKALQYRIDPIPSLG